MTQTKINSGDIVHHTFSEINFTFTHEAIHPIFTLNMHLPSFVKTESKETESESLTYCTQMVEKLIILPTYEYIPLFSYHLDMKADKEDWLKSCLILIVNNKELFFRYCDLDKYVYLIKLIERLHNLNATPSQIPLYENCEKCFHNFDNQVSKDIKLLEKLPFAERELFRKRITYNIKQLYNIRNLKIEDILNEVVNFEKESIELRNQLLKEQNELHEKKEIDAMKQLKQITANCKPIECVKIFAAFINNAKNKYGEQLFETDNVTISQWIDLMFYCTVGNPIRIQTVRDYLPPSRKIKNKVNKAA